MTTELRTIFTAVNFPIEPATIEHKWGGRITKVHGIAHREDRPQDGRSRDYWFFVADVTWGDGSGRSERSEVEPFKVCCDDPPNNTEMRCMMDAMSEYLLEEGEWCGKGRHEGWYARRKSGPVFDSTGRLMAAVGPRA